MYFQIFVKKCQYNFEKSNEDHFRIWLIHLKALVVLFKCCFNCIPWFIQYLFRISGFLSYFSKVWHVSIIGTIIWLINILHMAPLINRGCSAGVYHAMFWIWANSTYVDSSNIYFPDFRIFIKILHFHIFMKKCQHNFEKSNEDHFRIWYGSSDQSGMLSRCLMWSAR